MNYNWYRITTNDQLRTISTLKKRGYTVIRPMDYDNVIWTATSDSKDTVMLSLMFGTVEEYASLKQALWRYPGELNVGNIDTELMGL